MPKNENTNRKTRPQALRHDQSSSSQQQQPKTKKRKLQQQLQTQEDQSRYSNVASSSNNGSSARTTTPNENPKHNNQKREHVRKKKNYEQQLLSRMERVFGSSQSSSLSSPLVNRNDFKPHSRTQSQTSPSSSNASSSSSSSGSATSIPGFYFDEIANRYFPIPKNGLERSILVGNSVERMKTLQDHAMMKAENSAQQQQTLPTNSKSRIRKNNYLLFKNDAQKSIHLIANVNKKLLISSNSPCMLREEPHNKKYLSTAMTILKSRLMHPTADSKYYYKHVHNRMKFFEMRDKFSPLHEWSSRRNDHAPSQNSVTSFSSNVSNDQQRITQLECEFTSDIQLFTVKQLDYSKIRNHSTLHFNDEVWIFASNAQRDLCFSIIHGRGEERYLTPLLNLTSRITNISPFTSTHRNNYSTQEFQFLVSCTGQAQEAGSLTRFSMLYEQDIPTQHSMENDPFGKWEISYQQLYSCRKKTLFWHSVHPNLRWCALGLSKGGVIIDLERASTTSGESKQCHIGYTTNDSFSDVLLTYWNPYVTERGELLYARRDGTVSLMDCRMKSNNQNRQLQTCNIGEIQFSQGSFISDVKCVNESQFIVKSIESSIQHSSHHYQPHFKLFDKRKLSQTILNYELGTSQEESRLATNSIKEERENKMFLFDNNQYMVCGGITNSGSVVRIWDVYKGGKPEMTIFGLPHRNVSNMAESPSGYANPFFLMGIPDLDQLLLLKH
ncbi:hypothetical protein FDP41_009504 [Naegleria fowleri]|uniref:Uncharacterized protein n=1 Tax=Naegleria fowleri TaxID=5763 RepID=A0A6A5BBX9_NAEFO|nr:uncharacterized protein FDP41_009504 [Naegleria fowleri]KAF0972196.1 hypothetical protein FDP41_009504 [Naegleria fowleri]